MLLHQETLQGDNMGDLIAFIFGVLLVIITLTDPPRSRVATRPEPDTDRPTERKVEHGKLAEPETFRIW
jgi:hypothetical protein